MITKLVKKIYSIVFEYHYDVYDEKSRHVDSRFPTAMILATPITIVMLGYELLFSQFVELPEILPSDYGSDKIFLFNLLFYFGTVIYITIFLKRRPELTSNLQPWTHGKWKLYFTYWTLGLVNGFIMISLQFLTMFLLELL